jgi:hypothetical protein
MSYVPKAGETEFGGVPGMYPDENVGAPSMQQEVWAIYATNEAGGPDEESSIETSEEEWGRKHIGEGKRSYTPGNH